MKTKDLAERGGFEPPVQLLTVQRFSNSQEGSEPFRKFSTLPDSSTTYQPDVLIRYDSIGGVLSIELLQFYYSDFGAGRVWPSSRRAMHPLVLKITQDVLMGFENSLIYLILQELTRETSMCVVIRLDSF